MIQKILVINALNGVFPLVLKKKYPSAKITCAEVFPFYKSHLRGLGFEVVDWETMCDMKFDLVIGNPPYQSKQGNEGSTNSADLYTKFIDKCLELSSEYVALVVPSAWSGARDSKLKELLFETNQCMKFNTHGKKWFDVEMNTCWFLTQINRKGATLVTDAANNQVELLLNKNSVIPKDLTGVRVFEKLQSWSSASNLGKRWLRGKLHLNEITTLNKGKTQFIKAVGTKEGPLDIQLIPKNVESCGLGLHKLVVPNVSSSDSIGNIKFATPEMVGGHSVVFLSGDTQDNVQLLKRYLETSLVKFLVKMVKISTPNSKHLFELIPEMPTDWKTPQDLYDYFLLDANDIAIIENKA